jgi:hypothetical protein
LPLGQANHKQLLAFLPPTLSNLSIQTEKRQLHPSYEHWLSKQTQNAEQNLGFGDMGRLIGVQQSLKIRTPPHSSTFSYLHNHHPSHKAKRVFVQAQIYMALSKQINKIKVIILPATLVE